MAATDSAVRLTWPSSSGDRDTSSAVWPPLRSAASARATRSLNPVLERHRDAQGSARRRTTTAGMRRWSSRQVPLATLDSSSDGACGDARRDAARGDVELWRRRQ